MIRVFHTADLHLDAPFASLPREKRALRRRGLRACLSDMVQTALDNKVDVFAIVGDLFDSSRPSTDTFEFELGKVTLCLHRVGPRVALSLGEQRVITGNKRGAFFIGDRSRLDRLHLTLIEHAGCVARCGAASGTDVYIAGAPRSRLASPPALCNLKPV